MFCLIIGGSAGFMLWALLAGLAGRARQTRVEASAYRRVERSGIGFLLMILLVFGGVALSAVLNS